MAKQCTLDDYIANVRRIEPDPDKAGKRMLRASWLFDINGPGSRLALYCCHTRFGSRQWFVQDAETLDEATGLPEIVAQSDDAREAYRHALRITHARTSREGSYDNRF